MPVNALAIRILPASGRAWAGGIRSMALCLGAIAGGGLMLLAQSRGGWHAPFLIMASARAVGAALTLLVRNEGEAGQPDEPARMPATSARLRAYFRLDASRRWLPLLALLFPFIGSGWFYLKPLLLDQGLPADRVAWLAGGRGAASAAASVVGARGLKRAGPRLAVPAHAAASFAALLALAAAVALPAPPAVLDRRRAGHRRRHGRDQPRSPSA